MSIIRKPEDLVFKAEVVKEACDAWEATRVTKWEALKFATSRLAVHREGVTREMVKRREAIEELNYPVRRIMDFMVSSQRVHFALFHSPNLLPRL